MTKQTPRRQSFDFYVDWSDLVAQLQEIAEPNGKEVLAMLEFWREQTNGLSKVRVLVQSNMIIVEKIK